jgi:hypothetical protein
MMFDRSHTAERARSDMRTVETLRRMRLLDETNRA